MASFKRRNSTFLSLIITLLFFHQFSTVKSLYVYGDSYFTGSLRSKGLIQVKIWCMIILFGITFSIGISPYFLRHSEIFLSLGTQFAGGVFLGTSLMHFLNDATAVFEDVEYWQFMFASAGYVLAMLCERVVAKCCRRKDRMVVEEEGNEAEERGELELIGTDLSPVLVRTMPFCCTLLLLIALCCNSVFEGMSIGVAAYKRYAWGNLWRISLHKIFAAIAMSIAVLRLKPKWPFLAIASYSFAFAISSSIGIGLGLSLNTPTQGSTVDSIFFFFMAIASGVVIYVAINDLLVKGFKPQARSKYDTPCYKFIAVFAGVAVIAVVMIFHQ